ncbi:MAG: TOBE domain-containing protein, partial [Geminicoccaceae bacterium]
AGFLGDSNLIEGRVKATGVDWAEVATPFGVVRTVGSAQVGGEVTLAVRPEQFLRDEASPRLWQLGDAVVADAMFLGTYWRVLAVSGRGDSRFLLHLPPTRPPRAGDRIDLAVAPERVAVLES